LNWITSQHRQRSLRFLTPAFSGRYLRRPACGPQHCRRRKAPPDYSSIFTVLAVASVCLTEAAKDKGLKCKVQANDIGLLLRLPAAIFAVHDGPPSRRSHRIYIGIGVFDRRYQSSGDRRTGAVDGRWRGRVAVHGCTVYGRCEDRSDTVDVRGVRDITAHRSGTVGEYGGRSVAERRRNPVAVDARRRVAGHATPVAVCTRRGVTVPPVAVGPTRAVAVCAPISDAFESCSGGSR